AALASPPANDNFADAGMISALPFTDSGDLNGTTLEPGEQGFCSYQPQTVWYTFTPSTTTTISADLNGSQYGLVLTAYQSNGGNLGVLSCTFGGSLTFTANAGTTYYFQVGSYYSGPAQMQINVREIPPPANDDFGNPTPVGALPFNDSADMTAATTEADEPVTAGGFPIAGSAWYVFTPTESQSLTASASLCCTYATLAVYTGDSLTGLTHVKSVFDVVQFNNASYDPVGVGFQSATWSFGDGSSDTAFYSSHRYASDADYTVKLTVTTLDGRIGSATQTVHVKTHDVAITKFTAPNAASAGQTRQLSVAVNNSRYAETVQVQLLKSVPGSYNSFQPVGTLTLSVPAAPRNQTTPFAFSYTFTNDDAAVGKVSFEAVATIVNARDAQSADNTAITLPTKVNR
ncbi:MAG: hypothetical protein DMF82_23245, partial [Acidobacteria bacterium]